MFKIHLSKDVLAKLAKSSDEVALAVVKDQPELAAEFGLSTDTVLVRKADEDHKHAKGGHAK